MSDKISFSPIAMVKSQFNENTPAEKMREQPARIVVNPEFRPGLLGLAAGADILVLFYFNQADPQKIELQLHPRHNAENPIRGVFATRSQFRPNSIGATVVHLAAIEDNVLIVEGLDALDGTPVLDIKPFAPYFDADTESQRFEVRQVDSLEEARQKIDLIDAEIIRLLGNRAGYVHQVANFKKDPEEVPAPSRYAEVMRRRRELAEAAGLNPDVIEKMYKIMVDNFIKEEIEIIRKRETKQRPS